MSAGAGKPPIGHTLSDLTALFPQSHIEMTGDDDEIVIYTGMAVDEDIKGGTTLRWIEGMFDD